MALPRRVVGPWLRHACARARVDRCRRHMATGGSRPARRLPLCALRTTNRQFRTGSGSFPPGAASTTSLGARFRPTPRSGRAGSGRKTVPAGLVSLRNRRLVVLSAHPDASAEIDGAVSMPATSGHSGRDPWRRPTESEVLERARPPTQTPSARTRPGPPATGRSARRPTGSGRAASSSRPGDRP